MFMGSSDQKRIVLSPYIGTTTSFFLALQLLKNREKWLTGIPFLLH